MHRHVASARLPEGGGVRRSAGAEDSAQSSTHALAAVLLDALPQTQCRRCGFADCQSYAEAIAEGEVDINRCPPGGAEGVEILAAIAGRPSRSIDPDCGHEGPRAVAVIDEAACIGCALCLQACPVDAIVGAAKRMHTVIEASCTGCELCLPVCPVDCIALVTTDAGISGWGAWSRDQADAARARYATHRLRERQVALATAERTATQAESVRSRAVADAIARARARAGAAR